MAKHQRNQQTPDTAVAIQKRVYGFELQMRESSFYNGVGRLVQVMLEIRKTRIQITRRWRHEGRVARPRASNPVLRAAELTGLLLRITSIDEQNGVHFSQESSRHGESISDAFQPMIHGIDVARDFSYVITGFTCDLLDLVCQQLIQGGLCPFNLRGQNS